MSPQLVSVATMILVAVLVLTNTVSADGSIGGVYDAGLALAEKTGAQSQILPESLQKVNDNREQTPPPPPPPQQKQNGDQHKELSGGKPDSNGRRNR
jgi:hypothetical protein